MSVLLFLNKTIVLIVLIFLWLPIIFFHFIHWIFIKHRSIKADDFNVLVINNAKIGDMVCSSPVFREIKKKYPKSNLTLAINPKTIGIVKNNPNINEIVLMPVSSVIEIYRFYKKLNKRKFYASVNLVPGTLNYIIPFLLGIRIRSATTAIEYAWFYRILAFLTVNHKKTFKENYLSVQHYLDLLEPLNIKSANLKKEVFYTPEALKKAEHFLLDQKWNSDMILVGFSITAGNKIKEWPLDRFVEVGRVIYKKYGYIPLILGSNQDELQVRQATNLLKEQNVPAISTTHFSLEELPALFSRLSYFVSVDTGTLYIANALDIPVVDIAGPCNIYDQMPIYEKCEVVYVPDLPGWPYSSVLKTVTELSEEQMRCINDITPEMVLKSFDKLVKKYGK